MRRICPSSSPRPSSAGPIADVHNGPPAVNNRSTPDWPASSAGVRLRITRVSRGNRCVLRRLIIIAASLFGLFAVVSFVASSAADVCEEFRAGSGSGVWDEKKIDITPIVTTMAANGEPIKTSHFRHNNSVGDSALADEQPEAPVSNGLLDGVWATGGGTTAAAAAAVTAAFDFLSSSGVGGATGGRVCAGCAF